MNKLIVIIASLFIVGCGSSKIEVLPGQSYITNMRVNDAETGYFIAFAPCTLDVDNKTTIIVRYDANVSNYCNNHPECKDCIQNNNTAHASQEFDVDGDEVFYIGKR